MNILHILGKATGFVVKIAVSVTTNTTGSLTSGFIDGYKDQPKIIPTEYKGSPLMTKEEYDRIADVKQTPVLNRREEYQPELF
jgi:hypothetical protein